MAPSAERWLAAGRAGPGVAGPNAAHGDCTATKARLGSSQLFVTAPNSSTSVKSQPEGRGRGATWFIPTVCHRAQQFNKCEKPARGQGAGGHFKPTPTFAACAALPGDVMGSCEEGRGMWRRRLIEGGAFATPLQSRHLGVGKYFVLGVYHQTNQA